MVDDKDERHVGALGSLCLALNIMANQRVAASAHGEATSHGVFFLVVAWRRGSLYVWLALAYLSVVWLAYR